MLKLIALPASLPVGLPLLAGAAGAAVALAPTPAAAVDASCTPFQSSIRTISVNGSAPKSVGVIEGTWADVQGCINGNPPSPWWGNDNGLARDYARAYAAKLLQEGLPESTWLYPNGLPPANTPSSPKEVGPLVAWSVNGGGVQTWAVRRVNGQNGNGSGNGNGNGNGNPGNGTGAQNNPLNGNNFVVDPGKRYFWLVDPNGVADPAPAPLPLLGGAAATLWSRRLRRRLAGGRRAPG